METVLFIACLCIIALALLFLPTKEEIVASEDQIWEVLEVHKYKRTMTIAREVQVKYNRHCSLAEVLTTLDRMTENGEVESRMTIGPTGTAHRPYREYRRKRSGRRRSIAEAEQPQAKLVNA